MALESGFWEANLEGTVARMNASLCQKGATGDKPAHDAGMTGRWYYDTTLKILLRDGASDWEVIEHGHANHSNIDREIYVYPSYTNGTAESGGAKLADGVEQFACGQFKMPEDFYANLAIYTMWHCEGTGNLYWKMRVAGVTGAQTVYAHDDTGDYGIDAVYNGMLLVYGAPDVPTSIAELTVDDLVYIEAKRDGSHASDTVGADANVRGFVVVYTARQ